MKKLCSSIMIMVMCLPLSGYTLKGGVTYTVETARKEAFANVEYTLPRSIIEANMYDPNFKENVKAIKLGMNETDDRYIGYFSSGIYAIIYKKNINEVYYYTNDGKLESIENSQSTSYPKKSYKYDINGKLVTVILFVQKGERYIFTKDGLLIAHWINYTCYDKNGKVINTQY